MSIVRQKPFLSSNLSLGRWLIAGALAAAGLLGVETFRTSTPPAPNLAGLKEEPRALTQETSEVLEIASRRDNPRRTGDQGSSSELPRLRSASDDEEEFQALHPTKRIALVTAALQQAARKSPDTAVSEAIRYCDLDPSYSLEYGRALLSTLASSHDFSAALRFVLAEESEGGLGENGNKWLNALFITWGQEEPRRAAHAIDTVVSPGLRGEAMQAVAAGWAKTDPSGLADYVWQRTPTPEREFMLEVALRSWVEDDPVAVKQWMARHEETLRPSPGS